MFPFPHWLTDIIAAIFPANTDQDNTDWTLPKLIPRHITIVSPPRHQVESFQVLPGNVNSNHV